MITFFFQIWFFIFILIRWSRKSMIRIELVAFTMTMGLSNSRIDLHTYTPTHPHTHTHTHVCSTCINIYTHFRRNIQNLCNGISVPHVPHLKIIELIRINSIKINNFFYTGWDRLEKENDVGNQWNWWLMAVDSVNDMQMICTYANEQESGVGGGKLTLRHPLRLPSEHVKNKKKKKHKKRRKLREWEKNLIKSKRMEDKR